MASSSSSSFPALNCIGFFLILLLSFDIVRAARPAAVDPMLKVCSRTTYPKTCTECITTDTGRAADFDLRGMIGDIIFCAYSHATNAHDVAEALVNNCTIFKNCSHEDAVVKCNSTVYDASQQFLASFDVIQSKDLSKIQADLVEAQTKLNDCAYQQFAEQFPQNMIDEMDTTKRLQEIGTALCDLAPTVSVQN